MKQITVKNPNNLPCIEHDKLIVLQGDLKTLNEEDMGKLCHSIRKHGFFVPAFIWKSEGKFYILDATQRYHALTRMKEEGYDIPPIPYVEIEAEDKKDAAEKLLQITSRYGKINQDSTFLVDFDLELEDIDVAIPELGIQLDESQELGDVEEKRHTLFDKFIIPPFSILDTKQGYWQERKRAWIALGIKGEEGRDKGLVISEDTFGHLDFYTQKRKWEAKSKKKISTQEWSKIMNDQSGCTCSTNKVMDISGGFGKNLRSTSIFDPVLSEIGCKWFCPEKGKILDPMCGESVKGIVAGYLGYDYIGIDIRQEQITANKDQSDTILEGREGSCTWLLGNGKDVDAVYKGDKVDFIFSCPPYYDLEVYSEDKNDISTLQTYEEFIEQYQEIITKSVALLNDNRFACFVISDIRDKKGFYRNFVSDTIKCFIDAGMHLYNEMILVHVAGSLPIRAGKAFVNRKVGKMHENVLVFYKGDPKMIKKDYKEIDVEWEDTYQ